MPSDINVWVGTGNLTRDSELRYASSGLAIVTFSVAVNRRMKKGSEWTDEVSFFDCTMFDKYAETMHKHLQKGLRVTVQGELRQERWEKDGRTVSKVGIVVQNIHVVPRGDKPAAGESHPTEDRPSAPQRSMASPVTRGDDYEDAIPF